MIMISTGSKDLDKQKAFSAGANLYLVKPMDANRIIESMKMLLRVQ